MQALEGNDVGHRNRGGIVDVGSFEEKETGYAIKRSVSICGLMEN